PYGLLVNRMAGPAVQTGHKRLPFQILETRGVLSARQYDCRILTVRDVPERYRRAVHIDFLFGITDFHVIVKRGTRPVKGAVACRFNLDRGRCVTNVNPAIGLSDTALFVRDRKRYVITAVSLKGVGDALTLVC